VTPDERTSSARAPVTGHTRDVVLWLDRMIYRLARHWLLFVNLAVLLYVGLPVLAPVLMNLGLEAPAKGIYFLYRPACHQRPERSYFVGGPQAIYSAEELEAAGVNPISREIGTEAIGYKVAFCERDVAIYGSIFLAGALFGLVRRRLRPLPILLYLLFCLPMLVDGGLQLFGVYESTWTLRSVTGALFGFGSVWFAYPYLEEAFSDMRQTVGAKLGQE
jgi:uncharacterized membrane protein